jgi:hypothetical protein
MTGRPRVDTLKGSKHANMKELRLDAKGGDAVKGKLTPLGARMLGIRRAKNHTNRTMGLFRQAASRLGT